LRPATAKNRAEECNDEAAQLILDMLGQDWRLSDQHARYERPERRMDADEFGRQRHCQHDEEDYGDDRYLACHVIVGPADETRDQAAARSQAEREEDQRSRHARSYADEAHRAVRGHTGDDRDHDPGDRIVENRGREDQLPQVAPDGPNFHQDHSHNLHR